MRVCGSKLAGLFALVFCVNLAIQLKLADNRKLAPKDRIGCSPQKVKGAHNIESKEPTLCTAQDEGVVWKSSNSPLPFHHLRQNKD